MARKDIRVPLDRVNRNNHNDNYKELYGVVNNLVDTITDEVYEQIIDGAKLNWKPPVDSENDLPTSANEGDTVMTRDDGKVYRYDGAQWQEIQQIDAGPVNEVDSRLTSQLAEIVTNVKSFGAVGDGEVDDTQAIQSAIDFVGASGGGTILFPQGIYKTTEGLNVDFNNIELQGKSATLQNVTSTGLNGVFSVSGKNIIIRGFLFDGSKCVDYRNAHAIRLGNAENVLIEDCDVDNYTLGTQDQDRNTFDGNDGIYMRGSGSENYPKHVTVRNFRVFNLTRNGISIIRGEDIVIDNCYFASRRCGIDIEPNSSDTVVKVNNVRVTNCIFDGKFPTKISTNEDGSQTTGSMLNYHFQVAGHHMDSVNDLIENIYVEKCVMVGNPNNNYFRISMEVSRVRNFKGRDLVFNGINGGLVVYVGSSGDNPNEDVIFDNITVNGFTQSDSDTSVVFWVSSSKRVTLKNAKFYECVGRTLHLNALTGTFIEIENVELTNCGNDTSSIILTGGGTKKLTNLKAVTDRNISNCVSVGGSTGLIVLDKSTLEGKYNDGLHTYSGNLTDVVIKNSIFKGISGRALQMIESINFKLLNNVFENCGVVNLSQCKNATVIGNNFITTGQPSNISLSATIRLTGSENVLCKDNTFDISGMSDHPSRAILLTSSKTEKRIIVNNIIDSKYSDTVYIDGTEETDIVKDNFY